MQPTQGTTVNPVRALPRKLKLAEPEKWVDPVNLTSEPVKAADWIDSFLHYYHYITNTYEGVAEALPFLHKQLLTWMLTTLPPCVPCFRALRTCEP